jgi:hypothetical protein
MLQQVAFVRHLAWIGGTSCRLPNMHFMVYASHLMMRFPMCLLDVSIGCLPHRHPAASHEIMVSLQHLRNNIERWLCVPITICNIHTPLFTRRKHAQPLLIAHDVQGRIHVRHDRHIQLKRPTRLINGVRTRSKRC